MPSSLKLPLSRPFRNSPSAVFTTYQLPVDLYTLPVMRAKNKVMSATWDIPRLWEFAQQRPFQQELQRQQQRRDQRKRIELFRIPPQRRHLDLRLLQLVDLRIDILQTLIILCPVVVPPGLIGDLRQQLLIDIHLFPLHNDTAR